MNVPKDYKELFELLNSEKVKYLIVGAYALAFHGQPRYTGDIDIFIDAKKRNALKLINVIKRFGFDQIGITEQDFLKPDRIVQLGYPPLRIDIMTSIDGVSFERAWRHRIRGEFGKQNVWYISKKDLILNKRSTGRAQDKLDLSMIE